MNEGQEAKILISPIGAQGFILGRGNQQISARIVRQVGIRNIIVVATPHKLRETPVLYVDSGDPVLDAEFGDTVLVVSGVPDGPEKAHLSVRAWIKKISFSGELVAVLRERMQSQARSPQGQEHREIPPCMIRLMFL